jgi:hypothetical protein
MSTNRRFRIARERAASTLLTYVGDRTTANEQALLEAAHELEAVVVRSRLERVSQQGRAAQLARLGMSR